MKCKHREIARVVCARTEAESETLWCFCSSNAPLVPFFCSFPSGAGAQDRLWAQGRSGGEQILVCSHIPHCLLVISGYCPFPPHLHVQARPRRDWQIQFRHSLKSLTGDRRGSFQNQWHKVDVWLQSCRTRGMEVSGLSACLGGFPISKEERLFVFQSTL